MASHKWHKKSDARIAVEEALKTATIAEPMAPADVARLSGIPISICRPHIANCLNQGLIHNLKPGNRTFAVYAWGRAVVERVTPAPVCLIPPGSYDGRELRPFSGRTGAMDGYALPSVVDGEVVPRRAPIAIGSSTPLYGPRGL